MLGDVVALPWKCGLRQTSHLPLKDLQRQIADLATTNT
jgi:hypothetical protein